MKNIYRYIIGFVLGIGVTVGASYLYTASNISFNSSNAEWNVDNIQDAINSIRDDIDNKLPMVTNLEFNVNGLSRSNPSNTSFDLTTARIFTPNTYVVGLAYDNYFQASNVTSYSFTDDSITLKASSGYGLGFVKTLNVGTYRFTYTRDKIGGSYGGAVLQYSSNGSLISKDSIGDTGTYFVVGANTKYVVFEFYSTNNDTVVYNNFKLLKFDLKD